MTKEEKIFFIYIYLYIVWKKGKVRKEDIYKNNKKKLTNTASVKKL